MTIYPNLIIEALKNVRYPGTGKDIVSMGLVEDNIRIDGMNVTFSLLFEKPNDPFIRSVVKAAETATYCYGCQLYFCSYLNLCKPGGEYQGKHHGKSPSVSSPGTG